MNAEAIFAEALCKQTLTERAAYLDEVCGQDTDLRNRVETLLRAHEAAGSFLGKPAIHIVAEELASQATGETTEAESCAEDDDEPLGFMSPSDKPDSLGRLGHYEILEIIGRGAMGIVLRAFDEKLHRIVAIKVMATELAATSPPRKRFLREARSAAQVRHEHVVDIHAVEEQPIPYLVMEYVSGETLQQKLDRVGPLELPEVLRLGQQIARGLAAAHERGLIHRDIKPSNILLEKAAEERVKITDFGLARAVADASLTQSGVIAGTPMYMAPEQTTGDSIDYRVDLFSLGSVLYTMCSGRPPFRATTSMATLRRVAEDTPRPIREIIPEVPQWLCDIIASLHAKKPDDRVQSANEVADLLGKCLAELQQGQVVSVGQAASSPEKLNSTKELRATPVGARQAGSVPQHKRRWAIAAVVLLSLVAGVSLTEATDVTSLRATVIRIFASDGILVVETDDPAVKITVEGDGDLVITGAGPQEVRLRPGSYKLRATKEGKAVKLDQDLVTISRGGTQVVRVRLEGEAPGAVGAPKAEAGAFVVLGGDGVVERKFDSLPNAVAAAEHGDTIEIRGDGPFETDPVQVHGRDLAIRAGPGCRPVLALSARGRGEDRQIIWSDAALALEGLTLQRIGSSRTESAPLINTVGSPLRVANCRFVVRDNTAISIWGHAPPTVDVRNCEILGSRVAVESGGPKEGTLSVNNCLLATSTGVHFHHDQQVLRVDVRLTRNTFAGRVAMGLNISLVPDFFTSGSRPKARRFGLEVENNVFAVTECIFGVSQGAEAWRDKPIPTGPFKTLVTDLVEWRDQRNVYPANAAFMTSRRPGDQLEPLLGSDQLDQWQQFAGPEAGAVRGKVLFAGGDVLSQSITGPERLLPKHFSLRPQSPGYRAGKDGKDFGADIDLVGPGPAYERWKKTPEYQRWLKETGQKK